MRAKEVNFTGQTIRNLRIVKLIGQGNWADVYLGEDVVSHEKAAVKVTPLSKLEEVPKLAELVQAEIAILRQCRNPNVVRLLADFAHANHQFIVLEYCSGFELGEILMRERKLEEPVAINYLKQILNGFKGLHEVRAMHRDFKVENVMLHEGVCKIVDLGFGKQLAGDQVARTKLGSNLTMAPEVMQGLSYDFKADIWSIGVVFYQLLFGRFPIQGRSPTALLEKARKHDYSLEGVEVSEDSKDFITQCLKFEPSDRINWLDIYRHPLIADQNNQVALGPPQSKIDVEENEEFYLRSQKELEKEVAPPQAVKASVIRPPRGSYYKQRREEDREQEHREKQQSVIKSELELKSDIFEKEKSQIFLSRISEEQLAKEFSHAEQAKHSYLSRQNEQLSEQLLKEERMAVELIVRDIKYRYEEKLKDIEFVSNYATLTMQETLSQSQINHTPVLCLLFKDAYTRLEWLDDALNLGKNIFNVSEIHLRYFQEDTIVPEMVKRHMRECRERFEEYRGFLLEEYRDERLKKALESITEKDLPDYLLDEYLAAHVKVISNVDLSDNWTVFCKLLKLAFCLSKYILHKHHDFSHKRILATLNKFNCERAYFAQLRAKEVCSPQNFVPLPSPTLQTRYRRSRPVFSFFRALGFRV